MKKTLQLEEAAMFALAIYILHNFTLGLPIWTWALLFFMPDFSMLAYLVSTKIGALSYNIFHHKGMAICLAMWGYYVHIDVLTAIGILLFAHASFDRIWGYGLKYKDSFSNTHLGWIGKNK